MLKTTGSCPTYTNICNRYAVLMSVSRNAVAFLESWATCVTCVTEQCIGSQAFPWQSNTGWWMPVTNTASLKCFLKNLMPARGLPSPTRCRIVIQFITLPMLLCALKGIISCNLKVTDIGKFKCLHVRLNLPMSEVWKACPVFFSQACVLLFNFTLNMFLFFFRNSQTTSSVAYSWLANISHISVFYIGLVVMFLLGICNAVDVMVEDRSGPVTMFCNRVKTMISLFFTLVENGTLPPTSCRKCFDLSALHTPIPQRAAEAC